MQPGIADGQAQFFQEVEDEREICVGEGIAGQALVE